MSGLFINTDVAGLAATHQMSRAQGRLNNTLTQMSTGLAINSGRDNPAGLIASELMRSDIAAMNQAIQNTQRANSVMNIAESGMRQISSLLSDARVLAVEAANTGAMTPAMIEANQMQMNAILHSVNRIAQTTKYLDKPLLTGENAVFQLGPDVVSSQQLAVTHPNVSTVAIGNATGLLHDLFSGGSASLATNPAAAGSILQSAISSIAFSRGEIGTIQRSTFEPNIRVLQDTMTQVAGAEALISNADFGVLASRLARDQILFQTAANSLGLATMNRQMIATLLG